MSQWEDAMPRSAGTDKSAECETLGQLKASS